MDPKDAEKLAGLWTTAQSTVVSFVHTLVADRSYVDDLVQRTAMACVRKFDTYDETRCFNSWAIGIARFEVLAWRRSQAKDALVFKESLIDEIAQGYERLSDQSGAIRDALAACLEQADGRGRLALELFYGQGNSTEDIAKQLSASGGAIRTLIYRTRRTLRECIQRRLAAEGRR